MNKKLTVCALGLLSLGLSGCTAMQRGGLIGALIGGGAGAGIGACGGGVGVAIGAGAGAGAGLLTGAIAGEAYEIHRARMLEDYADVDKWSGEARVTTEIVQKYEKQLARMEARTKMMAARYEELVAKSYVLANNIQADGRYVQVNATKEGATQITMLSEVLFDEGKAQLREAVYPVLDEVGKCILRDYPDTIVAIEGHTDSNEVADGSPYMSDWELSAARSLSVLHFLEKQGGIDPARMAISSYSGNRPVASSDTPEGQRLNRRVVITLIPDDAVRVAPPNTAAPNLPDNGATVSPEQLDSATMNAIDSVLPPASQDLPGGRPKSEGEMLNSLPAFPEIK